MKNPPPQPQTVPPEVVGSDRGFSAHSGSEVPLPAAEASGCGLQVRVPESSGELSPSTSRGTDPQRSSPSRVAAPPAKPLILFDGQCGFCCRAVERWRQATGERVEYVSCHDPQVFARFPELPREALEQAVHRIEPDGQVFLGAAAVLRTWAQSRRVRWLRWMCERVPGAARLAEWAYRRIARHRRILPGG
jgi:predicted DCC family thiol-disulfide oxidoreductase YuxK